MRRYTYWDWAANSWLDGIFTPGRRGEAATIGMSDIMGNNFSDEEVCRSCAYCCRTYSWYTEWEDEALRFEYLDTDKVTIRKVGRHLWMITLDIPCSKLAFQDGKYHCTEYSGIRPEMCREYPRNVFSEADPDIMAQEMKDCPLVRAKAMRGFRKP